VCVEGLTCNQGQCAKEDVPVGDLAVTEISPTSGRTDEQTPVSIIGFGFRDGDEVRLGGTLLIAVEVIADGLISATVPKGMAPGFYTVIVSNSSGSQGHLKDGFEILDGDTAGPGKSQGCALTNSPMGDSAIALWCLFFLLIACRVTRARASQSASN
jgi:hypothetical protein